MKSYAVYARFYDAAQGLPDGAQYRYLLQRHHPKAQSVLEIACGTGAHLATLAKNYRVEGLDRSRAMLRHARKRLPDIPLHEQDMAAFELGRRFDAIVCPYDSLNHLLQFRPWLRTFKAAKRHLNPNGLFVFDVNTEQRLRALAAGPPWAQPFGDDYQIMTVTLSPIGIASWDIRVFERQRGSHYRLSHEVIRERAFPHERIMRALKTCFAEVRAYDPARWSRPKTTSARLFYVCR